MSVWVEIILYSDDFVFWLSRSTWACELKFNVRWNYMIVSSHAPRERVSWNFCFHRHKMTKFRHAPRERVSWNFKGILKIDEDTSHAPRERVSWNHLSIPPFSAVPWSRSTWACELKLKTIAVPAPVVCHAPRERVSWNNWFRWMYIFY